VLHHGTFCVIRYGTFRVLRHPTVCVLCHGTFCMVSHGTFCVLLHGTLRATSWYVSVLGHHKSLYYIMIQSLRYVMIHYVCDFMVQSVRYFMVHCVLRHGVRHSECCCV